MSIESRVNLIQSTTLEIGLSTNVDEYLYFDNGDANKPGFRLNTTTSKIQYTNDGTTWLDFTSNNVGGDLSGILSDAYVIGFNSYPLNTIITPTSGQSIYYNSAQGKWTYSKIGGDVSGTITNVDVIGLKGIDLSLIAPEEGFGYLYNATQNKWIPGIIQTIAPPIPTPTTGGDCSGLVTNITVVGFNGYSLADQVPTDGQVLYYNSTQSKWWCGQITGDVSGALPDVSVDKINNIAISTNVPVTGNTYTYELATNKWIPNTITFPLQYSLNLFNVGGRLTLESGYPFMVDPAGYSNKETLYWSPMKGGNIVLYDSISLAWTVYTPGEISITTAGLVAEKIYDVFMYVNTSVCYLVFGPAWTDDFTRSQELTTLNNIIIQVSTKYRYLGSIRTFGTTPVYFNYRYDNISLWNYYNRTRIPAYLRFTEVTDWTIPATPYLARPFNNNVNKYIGVLIGIKEDYVKITCLGISYYSGYSGIDQTGLTVGIGINAVGTLSGFNGTAKINAEECRKQVIANYEDYIYIGYSKIYAIEATDGENVITMTGAMYGSSAYCPGLILYVHG